LKHRHQNGMTLVEVVIAIVLISVVASAVAQSMVQARRMTYANAQRWAAFGLCRAKMEDIRSTDYDLLPTMALPEEPGLEMSHLSGRARVRLLCDRTTTVEVLEDPARTVVSVSVTWDYLGRPMEERLTNTLYRKK
jgi:prepilin-type N-terminal cleavage/methylation domain-containing protein